MTRCFACHRIIWPWSRRGWIVSDHGIETFHSACHPWRDR